MKPVTYDEIIEILDKLDQRSSYKTYVPGHKTDSMRKALSEYYSDGRLYDLAVLGIDVYKYSKFPEEQQNLLPAIFEFIYDDAIKNCLDTQKFLFQKQNHETIKSQLISTGDGGFQIFDTPLHCFLMAIYFEAALRRFNSYMAYPVLRDWIGSISIRYTITYGRIFQYGKNYFGPAIINNARIISKDKLNRFLVDHLTVQWFQQFFTGIENIMLYGFDTISSTGCFDDYNKDKLTDTNIVFNVQRSGFNSIHNLIISKIGNISIKDDILDIYSVYTQLHLTVTDDDDPNLNRPLIISLGNLNVQGISE